MAATLWLCGQSWLQQSLLVVPLARCHTQWALLAPFQGSLECRLC